MRLLRLLLLSPFELIAQKKDTIYFDEGWKETDQSSAEYHRVLWEIEDKGWKAEDHYFKNDKLQMSGYYKTKACNIKQGDFVYYDDKGDKTSECGYNNDKLEGRYVSYINGFKEQEGEYRKGLKIGVWTGYRDSTTEVFYVERFSEGRSAELKSFYPGGKLKRIETHTTDGTITGKCYDMNEKETAFTPFMIMPKPSFSLADFLSEHVRYPDYARRRDIEGRVIVRFVVKEDGSITDVKAIQKIGGGCDEEAVRVVAAMPGWEPGIRDDKVVKIFFTQPISFRLR